MGDVALFHSVLGLREVEMVAARRMEAAGHRVVVPDLYAGHVADTLEDGFELMNMVGWETICARARAALDLLPETTVLAGHSMGAGVVAHCWPDRQLCGGVVLLHGLARIPGKVRSGVPVTVHVADPDRFAMPEEVVEWTATATRAGLRAEVFSYPNAGHFFTDQALSDYDAEASGRTWQRVLHFLETVAAA